MKLPCSGLCVFFLLLSSSLHLLAMAEVITLTADTFSDKMKLGFYPFPYQCFWMDPGDLVKEKDTVWFIQFCVPWCKHCKKLGTLWEDLGRAVEGEDEIEIGQVDCSTSKSVCTKVDIHSYPTFKLFYDGEELAKYKGTRNVESLKAFVLDEADKAAKGKLDDDKDSL